MDPPIRRMHLALNARDVGSSVAFYRSFFGVEPVQHVEGFAKFKLDNPPLTLSLNQQEVAGNGALNHLGLELPTGEALLRTAERLQKAGFELHVQKDSDCCFALQDKVWLSDPDGYPWEVYVVKVADTQPELTRAAS